MTEEEMKEKYISKCDKCEEMFPTVIFTCNLCCTEVANARGYSYITLSIYHCFECWKKIEEKLYRYEDIVK